MFYFISSSGFSETFLNLRRIRRNTKINEGHAVAQLGQALRYKLEFYENPFCGNGVVPFGWKDRRTYMIKLIVTFCNFANASKIMFFCNFLFLGRVLHNLKSFERRIFYLRY